MQEAVGGGEVKGFTIRCKGDNNEDEDVIVSDADAQAMSRNCEYFQNVFAHGTREAKERLIPKPDWLSSTTKQLVQLLTTGKTAVPGSDREAFYLLEEAAQQILLNISLHFPEFVAKGNHVGLLDRAQIELLFNVTEQLMGPKVEVHFPAKFFYNGPGSGDKPISVDDWLTLLDQGITIKNSDDSAQFFQVVLETYKSPPKEEERVSPVQHQGIGMFLPLDLDDEYKEKSYHQKSYHLQAHSSKTSIGTMLNSMCQMLHQHRLGLESDVRVYSQEQFSLRLPCKLLFSTSLEKTAKSFFNRESKVKLHRGNSLGYFLGGSSTFVVCPTIVGTLQQIRAFLSVIPEELMQSYSAEDASATWCSLRVCAPSSETMDRLVKAVGACQDNPNTLGVDVRSKAFFAVKSVNDMKLLLAAMINGGGSTDTVDVVPTLVILEEPKGIF